MINDARQYIWTAAANGLAGAGAVHQRDGFNLLGDALRDRLDPHLIAEHSH